MPTLSPKPTTSLLVLTIAAACLSLGIFARQADAASTFRVNLTTDGTQQTRYVECWVNRKYGALDCLAYGKLPPRGAHCSFGGTILTARPRADGSMRRTFTCVGEGSHDQPVLSAGRVLRLGPFRCAVVAHGAGYPAGEQLRCIAAKSRGFSLDQSALRVFKGSVR